MTTEAAQQTATTPNPGAAGTQAQPTQAATAQPQASPAPAATPAAPATTTPAAAATANDAPAVTFGEPVEYVTTGIANLDYALQFAGKLGLSSETHPEMQQAMEGNFGPLRALLAQKQVPGGEAVLALAESGYREMQAGKEAKAASVQKLVVEAAGSEEAWAEVLDWAKENAEPAERDAVNYAFEQGGFLAEAVAAHLVNAHRMQPGVSTPPGASPATSTASARSVSAESGPLSPKEFAKVSRDLRTKLGVDFESSQEYKRAVQRRNAWRG